MKPSDALIALRDELAGIRSQISGLRDSRTAETAENNRHYRVQNSIRWATWCAFGAAVIYATIAAGTYRQISKQYTELQKSADAASVSIRPWIKIDSVELVQATGSIKTLMFHWPPTGKPMPPMIQIKASLVNVGHTVAQDVQVSGELFFGKFVSDNWYNVVTQEQNRYCQIATGQTPSGPAQIVFPSDRWEQTIGVGGLVRETDVMRTPGSSLTHSAASLILCINYKGATSERLQTQTRFSVYEDKAVLIELGTDTDATRLSLIREPTGDHAD